MEPKRKTADLSGKSVLVVEDDPSIAIGLRINLESEGYAVTVAEDGERGLELARSISPDLIVLDVMLPKKNGLEVLHDLRAEGRTMPIIILSAKAGEMDKVAGLELGAEDYVAKPFSLAELLARVRAALRRGAGAAVAPRTKLAIDDVEVDIAGRSVRRAGEPIEMTATEFDVLVCLMNERGRVLSRDDIFRRVWGPNHHGTPRTVDNFIQQLRAKLERDPQEPVYIQTVRGVGYRFGGG
ncbi:Phosphate regulon transcriptional regulatory protein PhoB (SphR) [Labilithrix luteola]|uniref:Phosphate regulon transcriptional regulatory protein PhoB n=1 Tax=Labilithrix luteola TaxID=1391654 RepID=A0A0K1PLK1_9BACT|nr:Phosphate regulon transcriptional regulatory protein PhoB (SphR) [Labilithrix luteola]